MKPRLFILPAICLIVALVPALAADWPQWRGPDRTGISKETGLLQKWPEKGPPLAWTYEKTGWGFSSMAVVGDRLYTMARRLPGLEIDPEYNDLADFDPLTYVTVGPPGLEDLRAAPGIRVSTTGRPMVAALAGSDATGEAAALLLRLTSSLIFADGFETGSTASWP